MSDLIEFTIIHAPSIWLAIFVGLAVWELWQPRYRLAAFLSPAAFERRARQRERQSLVRELDEMDQWRVYYNCREPVAVARLQALAREDGYQAQ
jgi:hypothetical protein